jgi:hypothetical protein
VNWLVLVELVKSNKENIKTPTEGGSEQLSPSSFYIEEGKYVFTEEFHKQRGSCCGNGCRHCPYFPKYKKGNTTIFIDNG